MRIAAPISFALALMLVTCASRSSGDPAVHRPPAAPDAAAPQWKHDWSRGAVFYELFVRSFKDSNGDGIGDIKGLISKLDYLNDGNPTTTSDLGVDALWLMPVFESPSYHGYDVVNYEKIEPDYGTNADFEKLLSEAHKRGIRIIVDYVINHSSSDHPWFIESASSPSSSKRSWYVWSPTDPGWKQPWGGNYPTWHPENGQYFYGVFWEGMPDLNFRTLAVRQTIKKTASFWLKKGLDGFRLDATRYLIETGAGAGQADTAETHSFLKELSLHVRKVRPQATMVGENWTDTPIIAKYFGSTVVVTGGDELPMNFNFPLSSEILTALRTANAAGVAAKFAEMKSLYPPGANDAPFLTNHDQVRLATQLGTDSGRLRNAAAVLLTLPGSPFLYYGEEVGIQNGTTDNDEAKRTPMPWDASEGGGFTTGSAWFPFSPGRDTANVSTQTRDSRSLLSRYRAVIAARKRSSALQRGTIEMLTPTTGQQPVLAFIRADAADRVLVAHNLSDSFVVGGPYNIAMQAAERIWGDPNVDDPSGGGGTVRVTLPPRYSGIWRLR